MSAVYDLLIVGSGPSGVQAATVAVAAGARVAIVDVGLESGIAVPAGSWQSLRDNDPRQREYFLGEAGDPGVGGAHITPPRRAMVRDAEALFPVVSDGFHALLATGRGGLGAGWGCNVFTLEAALLGRIGLSAQAVEAEYAGLAEEIGVSGDAGDDVAPRIAAGIALQPPLRLDTNATRLLAGYARRRERIAAGGFRLGQSVLAVLSEARAGRAACAYDDMDFYGDGGGSAYRPGQTLDGLRRRNNFAYLNRLVAHSFSETAEGVTLRCRALEGGERAVHGSRLLLAAGAINSGRLALQSFPHQARRLPLLTNPNRWIAAVNLAQLGRPAADARHSLAQLTGLYAPAPDFSTHAVAQFYSYRSLLWSRLLPAVPLPPRAGLQLSRLLATALTCVNVHFADQPSAGKFIELVPGDGGALRIEYEPERKEAERLDTSERALRRLLWRLRCPAMAVMRPAHGASLHYAGTLPRGDGREELFTTAADGRLHGTRCVYAADASSWRFLPAQGLTFTLMANARRLARELTCG